MEKITKDQSKVATFRFSSSSEEDENRRKEYLAKALQLKKRYECLDRFSKVTTSNSNSQENPERLDQLSLSRGENWDEVFRDCCNNFSFLPAEQEDTRQLIQRLKSTASSSSGEAKPASNSVAAAAAAAPARAKSHKKNYSPRWDPSSSTHAQGC